MNILTSKQIRHPNDVAEELNNQKIIELPKKETDEFTINSDIKKEDYVRIPNTNTLIQRTESFKGENWNDTHYALQDNGLFMPNPKLFTDYFLNVRKAINKEIILYNGDNNPIPYEEVKEIWNYLTAGYNKGCFTWLDAKFEQKQDGLYLLTNHIIQSDNSLKPQTIEKLEDCITGSYYVDLKFNNQGMPIKKSNFNKYKQGENIYFFNPIDKFVVRFYAYSDGASLDCSGDPSFSHEGLGVFGCAEGTQKK